MKKLIEGNTYPVKDRLKALGAKWNADKKAWEISETKYEEAIAVVNSQPAVVPGKCSKCGKECKPPYTLCFNCKPGVRYTRCKQCGAAPGPRGWPRIYRNGVCSDCYKSDQEEHDMGY